MLVQLCSGIILMVSLTMASVPVRFVSFSNSGDHSSRQGNNSKPTKVVESFRVRSDIRYRFATTQMSSVIRNVARKAQEIGFDVTLPKNAFIMDFYMTIDGKRYDGEVKERKEAKRQYQNAVDKGQSAGHVRQAPRHANVFEVSVNVAAGSAVNFTLTYQEVLRRRKGVYEHEIHVNPGQPVKDFRIEVFIRENRPLKFVRTPALRKDYLLTNQVGKLNKMTIVDKPRPEIASIVYEPSLSEQGDEKGLSARFVVQYDVEHAGPKGDVLVVDGYFVHFLVPDSITQTLPKDIIFVLDVSGSMHGTKIRQQRVAMETILLDLQANDRFNIITFSSGTSKWKDGLVPVNKGNIDDAQSFVDSKRAEGMTNINDALLTALSEMNSRQDKVRVGLIFFLTDGNPTQGEKDSVKIMKNVLNASEKTVAIFSLAFGEGADYNLLKGLSAQNFGFARKIYEATDAALQVSSLYDEISAVSIKDLSVTYQNSSVDAFSLTDTEFPLVFNGSEIMICGALKEHSKSLKYEIKGLESEGDLDIFADIFDIDSMVVLSEGDQPNSLFTGPRDFSGMIERMWAYQTIRQLLREKEKHASDTVRVKQVDERILELSLKYKFVTPLTSMVVTKPDKGEAVMHKSDSSAQRLRESTPLRSAMSHAKVGKVLHDPLPSRSKSYSAQGRRPMVAPFLNHRGPGSNRKSRPRKPVITGATSKLSFKTRHNTTCKPIVRGKKQHSVLKLVTITKRNDTNPHPESDPYLCVVPKRWRFGKITLIKGPRRTRVVLRMCPRRQCKKQPSLQSLVFFSGKHKTEVWLEGKRRWHYSIRPGSQFSVLVVSNNKLQVLGPGLNSTVEWTQNGPVAEYNLNFVTDLSGRYSGVLGKLMSQSPTQLKRRRSRKAKTVCQSEKSKFAVIVTRKMAKHLSGNKKSKSRKNRN